MRYIICIDPVLNPLPCIVIGEMFCWSCNFFPPSLFPLPPSGLQLQKGQSSIIQFLCFRYPHALGQHAVQRAFLQPEFSLTASASLPPFMQAFSRPLSDTATEFALFFACDLQVHGRTRDGGDGSAQEDCGCCVWQAISSSDCGSLLEPTKIGSAFQLSMRVGDTQTCKH